MENGIHEPLRTEPMTPSAQKMRDFYAMKPGAPFFLKEFGYYSLERWRREGHLLSADQVKGDYDAYLRGVFGFDEPGVGEMWGVGWAEAAFCPYFEEKRLEDRGEHELWQDVAGRDVLYFKGRKRGFMPEYVAAPVKDMKTWKENVQWRLDPRSPERLRIVDDALSGYEEDARRGLVMCQRVSGGYMYLRSLIGPEELCYMFYDAPEVIHDCMQTWLVLADAVTARVQARVTYDEVFMGEDICYNHGPLISPDMMKEFLFPYYQQLLTNIRRRQIDKSRHLFVQIDTDGFCLPVIDLYREAIGADYFSPFEVAAGSDAVQTAAQWPELLISGGIDKRVLSQGPEAIDRHLAAILPVLHARGGYIPTCDHGVPEEVSFENYLHFRRRVAEYA